MSSEHHLVLLRNLVVAPLTEEVVFRGLMVPALFSACCWGEGAESSATTISLRAPLFFGVAHLHHLADRVWTNREPPLQALAGLALQLTYTTVFGALATHLLLRTGNLAAPVTSHVICNFVGLPDLGFMRERSRLGFLHAFRYPLLALHALGLLACWLLLDSLTSSASCVGLSPFWTDGQ